MGTFDLWNTLSTTNEPYTDLLFDKDIDEYMYNSYDDYSFINADLCTLDTLDNTYRSIHDDIKQIESSSQSSISGSISPIHDNNDIDIKFELESKVEIRNVDCMWSGLGNLNNNTATTTTTTTNIINSQNNDKKQQSQRTNQQQQQQRQNSLTNNNSNSKNNNNNNGGNNNNNTINNSLISNKLSAKNIQNIPPGASLLINSFKREQKKSNISSSSLSSSNKYNNALSLTDGATIPNILTSDFLKDRETTIQQQQTINNNCTSSLSSSNTNINLTSLLARPDTPLSLDDDAPEFKHSVDLAACITGSNNICLDLNLQETNDKMIINKLKEQLEDTSTENIDIRQIIPGSNCNRKKRSLTEVLHAIGSIENDNYYNKNTQNCNSSSNSNSNSNNNNNNNNSNNNSSSNNNCHTQHNEHLQQQYIFSNGGINTAPESELSHSSSESEVDDDDDDCDEYDDTELSSSSCAMLNGNSNIFRTPLTSQFRKNNNYTTYIDHSYTRSNESNVDVVGIGLETPSDSDEEIDVVSVGDKKLPTNPSDKDRRALQNKVANKISARIVKTPNGIRTIPARKQRGNINGSGGDGGRGGGGGSGGGTFDPPYTIIPISNMVSSPIKSISVGNPRYNNNNNNNDKNSQQQQQYSNNSNNITTLKSQQQQQQSNSNSISAGRKRNNNGTILNKQQQQNDEYLPPSKKSRNNCSNSTINNSNNNSHTNSNSNSSNCSTSSNSSSSSNNNNNNNHHHQHTNNSNNIKNNHNTNNNRKSTNGRRNYDMEEQDTIEKRNLHNDMERQRRIGLKNLFEELKKQIPSIKDKERAPKVHILREAAKLCEQLMLDEKTMLNQKNQLLMQIHRKKEYLDAKFE